MGRNKWENPEPIAGHTNTVNNQLNTSKKDNYIPHTVLLTEKGFLGTQEVFYTLVDSHSRTARGSCTKVFIRLITNGKVGSIRHK